MYEIFLKSMTIIPPLGVIISSLFITRRRGIDKNHTVSVLAARDKNTAKALSWTLGINGTLYYLALYFFIAPKYDLQYMGLIMGIAAISMLFLAIFPADSQKPWSYVLHHVAGWLISGVMYVLAIMLWLSPVAQSSGVSMVAGWYVVLSSIAGIGLILSSRLRKEKLIFEVVFIAAFYVVIVAAAFLQAS